MKKYATLLAALALAAGGCAPKNWNSKEDGPFDPFEGLNRQTYKFNKAIDFLVLEPAATAYSYTPQWLQTGVGNVYSNFKEPANAFNNAVRREGDATVITSARFAFNTVFGVAGFFDVAEKMGLERQEADFGQTLRAVGLRDTVYVVLPVFGPTTFADGIGAGVDGTLKPNAHIEHGQTRYAFYGVGATHARAGLIEELEIAEQASLDEYAFVRDIYEERRLQDVSQENWLYKYMPTGRGAAW